MQTLDRGWQARKRRLTKCSKSTQQKTHISVIGLKHRKHGRTLRIAPKCRSKPKESGEFRVSGDPSRKAPMSNTDIVVARKLEHHYPHALEVKYKGS